MPLSLAILSLNMTKKVLDGSFRINLNLDRPSPVTVRHLPISSPGVPYSFTHKTSAEKSIFKTRVSIYGSSNFSKDRS